MGTKVVPDVAWVVDEDTGVVTGQRLPNGVVAIPTWVDEAYTYAQLSALASAGGLTPNSWYVAADSGVRYWAADASSLERDAPVIGGGYCSRVSSANYASTLNHATSTYLFLGGDPVDNRVFIKDTTGGRLLQSSDLGATFSTSKGLPADVSYANIVRMLRFGAKLYLLAKATSDNIYKIWSCDPASGSTAFTWSSPLHSMTDANSSALYQCFSADAAFMYLAEYGDPGAGPRAWRSADGVVWGEIYSPDVSLRHVHAIAPDPYNDGHVYMTCGDGIAKSIQRSTDYGDTWEVIVASSAWQAVQISFSADYVFFAGDSQRGLCWFMNRADAIPQWYSPSILKNIAVPSAAVVTDAFYYNAWFGCVEPSSGIFYSSANDSSAGGQIPGLFQITGPGQSAQLIEKYAGVMTPVEVFGGYVWVGKYRRLVP